jgi:hypothetical protein
MADPLTSAERRVLDLLLTQLSAPQIAARLSVSGNTVQTRMSHLYATLGGTTPTDAGERPRAGRKRPTSGKHGRQRPPAAPAGEHEILSSHGGWSAGSTG